MRLRLFPLLVALLLWTAPTVAHDSRPAYLQVKETQPGQYDVLWKRPQRGDFTLALSVLWPETCRDAAPGATQLVPGALIERRLLNCGANGILGQRIAIEGL